MDKPTVERCIETRFFQKHSSHMPAILNLGAPKEPNAEIIEDLIAGQ